MRQAFPPRALQPQRLGHASAISRIGLAAVVDMTLLDEAGRITHCTGGVLEQHLLLFR